MSRNRAVLFLTLALGVLVASPAAAEPVAVLRADSLDALDGLTGTLGLRSQGIAAQLLQPMGINDVSWVDSSRPIGAGLSIEGLMLGAGGAVLALPVKSVDGAFEVFGQQGFERVPGDDDELVRFERNRKTLTISVHDDYFLLAASPRFLSGIGVEALTLISGMPAGPVGLEIDVEALAPMMMMGLETGRRALNAEMRTGSGEEAEAMSELMGVYLDLLRDVVQNTARLQLSVESTASHMIVHKRLIARPGSTLDGLVQAQGDGETPLARFLGTGEEFATIVGSVTPTPALVDAINGYSHGYLEAIKHLSAELGADAQLQLGGWLDSWDPARWLECGRGDFAARVWIDEAGLAAEQLSGVRDAEACAGVLEEIAQAASSMAAGPGTDTLLQIEPGALEHRGVRAMRQRVRLPPTDDGSEEEREAIDAILPGGEILTFTGVAGDVTVSTTGAEAENRFRALVDRILERRGRSFDHGVFEPLEAGPGMYVAMDFGRLAESLAPLYSDEDASGGLDRLAGMQLVYGLRFDETGLNVEVALPQSVFDREVGP